MIHANVDNYDGKSTVSAQCIVPMLTATWHDNDEVHSSSDNDGGLDGALPWWHDNDS